MRRSNGQKRAQAAWLLPAITAACLASAGAAQACPSSSYYNSKKAAEERAMAQPAAQAAADEGASIDCPYSKRSRPMSTSSKLALAAAPAAVAAFALGWRSGARRRRSNHLFDETTK
ncbi:MAG TPA: hypothetical protein VFS43_38045 [Polyangiaceae bacterium]|nr:hypothetical protein [Polyangiaceae bacterium]